MTSPFNEPFHRDPPSPRATSRALTTTLSRPARRSCCCIKPSLNQRWNFDENTFVTGPRSVQSTVVRVFGPAAHPQPHHLLLPWPNRQHSVTGETTPVYGGGLVSPVGTVNPSPVVYPGGAAVFTPSPVYPVAPAKKKKDKGKGWWETMYDEDGDRYWEHTVTKKKTYKDPYY